MATITAGFQPKAGTFNNVGTVAPVWLGVFDFSYTREGDYLVSPSGIFFVGTQAPGNPVQCILTNRSVSLSRPTFAVQGGYSGLSQSNEQLMLVDWPASILQAGQNSPGDGLGSRGFGAWVVMLPILASAPRPLDVMTDDLGSTYVVDTAEQSVLGWRLHVRQIGA